MAMHQHPWHRERDTTPPEMITHSNVKLQGLVIHKTTKIRENLRQFQICTFLSLSFHLSLFSHQSLLISISFQSLSLLISVFVSFLFSTLYLFNLFLFSCISLSLFFSLFSLLKCVCIFHFLSFSSTCHPCFLSQQLSFYLFCVSLLNDDDNDHLFSHLSLWAQPCLTLIVRVWGPWSLHCWANMFAPCKKKNFRCAFAGLVPLGVKCACTCAGDGEVFACVKSVSLEHHLPCCGMWYVVCGMWSH